MRAAVILLASLTFGGPALAAHEHSERAPAAPAPECKKISDIKSENPHLRFTVLTPGQFHFIEGVYVGSPSTPPGMPPGDGAMLLTGKGASSAFVIWTHGDKGCNPLPIPIKLAEMIPGIKTGAGETIEPSDGGEGDLSL